MSTNVVGALNTSDGNLAEASAWLIGYCGFYSNVVLAGAALFLVGGFVFVVIAAKYEAEKAKAEADKARAEARLAEEKARRAEGGPESAREFFPISVAVTAAKGFAEALGTAKAWLAMVIIGLLLLWLAGSAPQMCVSGESGEPEQTSPQSNSGAGAGQPGNSAQPGNAAEVARPAAISTTSSPPPTEGSNRAGDSR